MLFVFLAQRPGVVVPRLVHDGAGQVVGPVGGVVVGPDAGVYLGDDDLVVGRAELVDFFREQGGRVDAVGADFDFLGAVARDQLMRVDGFFQRGGVAGDAHQAQADGNDVIGEGGHGVDVFDLKFSGRVQAGVEEPEAELRKFVELDFVAVVHADVVEAREFDHQAVHHALAMIVEARRAGTDEIVEAAVVFCG